MDKSVNKKPRAPAKANNSIPAFLLKTYEILDNQEYSDVVSWNGDGSAFFVKNITDFSEKVLPKYFKHSNFASFVRQLNMYDFHKTRHDNNENEFRHHLFRRGSKYLVSSFSQKSLIDLIRHLLAEIKRKTTETTAGSVAGASSRANQLEDDDFSQQAGEDASYYWEDQQLQQQQQFFPQPQQQKAVFSQPQPQPQQPQYNTGMPEYGVYEQSMVVHQGSAGGIVATDPRFPQDVAAIKAKLNEVEGATKAISLQNAQLIKENRLLWHEMLKNKEKNERKVEKLVLFIFSMLKPSLTKSLGSNPAIFKKALTEFASRNFQSASNSANENNMLAPGENSEESKKEITDALALLNEGLEDNMNPELEKTLKNYPSLLQKANSANSKTETKKLMEDYFSFLQNKDKQASQPTTQLPQQQPQQNRPGNQNSNANLEPTLRQNSNPRAMNMNGAGSEFSQFGEKNPQNQQSAMNAYIQNPTQTRTAESFDKFQDSLSQNQYPEYNLGKPLGQPFKQQKIEPTAPNLVASNSLPQFRDPMSNAPPMMNQANGNGMNFPPNGYKPEFNKPTMPQGLNPPFNPQPGNFQYGNAMNAPQNQYYRDDLYKNQAVPSGFNGMSMNQMPYPQEHYQAPYNAYSNQGYMPQPGQNSMIPNNLGGQFVGKGPNPQTQMVGDLSRKSSENVKGPVGMQGMNAPSPQMNNGQSYLMPGMSNDFEETKRNLNSGPTIKSAQAFPGANVGGPRTSQRDASMMQNNRRNQDMHEDLDKFLDGGLNTRNSSLNDQDMFPRIFDEHFDRQHDLFKME